MRRRMAALLGNICLCSEGDQIPSEVRRKDEKQGTEELADAAEDELEAESVIQGPDERALTAALCATGQRGF